ncbi:MAG: HD domain-containing protein [Betaproteobacteria bacterium]|nr:HD domain-containing protein [Betaproteobacteria bacterium]
MLEIHRIVIKRLFLAWLALSIVAGTAIYIYEIEKIDDTIVAHAAAEAERFAPDGIDTASLTAAEIESLRLKAQHFISKNFVVLETYDQSEKKLFEAVNPAYEAIEKELAKTAHRFPRDGQHHYERFNIGGETLVRILMPLTGSAGVSAGYFEAVFVVDQEELAHLQADLERFVLIALLCVLGTTLPLYPVIISLNRDVLRFSSEVVKGNLDTVSVLGTAIAQRDSDTGDHNYRVTLYAIRLAEAIGTEKMDMRSLILGAFLHDVGKIGISDNILLKPGKLDEGEFAIMRTHVDLGVRIIGASAWLLAAREVIECHHEKYDGGGYPRGLRGEEIPLVARIFAVVDVFDALTSRRPYKEPWPFDKAMDTLEQDAGSHFDPRVVAAFKTFAAALHAEIGNASESDLSARMRPLVERYYLRSPPR